MAKDMSLVCRDVSKTYHDGDNQIAVLDSVSFELARGEKIAILGSSGSGKSTLLHILGGLDHPTAGSVEINKQVLAELSSNALAALRNQKLGFIYQFHHLLAEFTAVENVAMPLMINGELSHRIHHLPSALSGGERQRVAIARALVNNPSIVLADEPTGNLDNKTGAQIYALLCELSEQMGTSFIVVTHDIQLANSMDRVLELTNGKLSTREQGAA